MVISIRDFISTGHFGPIKIGVTKGFVIDNLGDPIKITEFENGLAEILYNGLDFSMNKKIKGFMLSFANLLRIGLK